MLANFMRTLVVGVVVFQGVSGTRDVVLYFVAHFCGKTRTSDLRDCTLLRNNNDRMSQSGEAEKEVSYWAPQSYLMYTTHADRTAGWLTIDWSNQHYLHPPPVFG